MHCGQTDKNIFIPQADLLNLSANSVGGGETGDQSRQASGRLFTGSRFRGEILFLKKLIKQRLAKSESEDTGQLT